MERGDEKISVVKMTLYIKKKTDVKYINRVGLSTKARSKDGSIAIKYLQSIPNRRLCQSHEKLMKRKITTWFDRAVTAADKVNKEEND